MFADQSAPTGATSSHRAVGSVQSVSDEHPSAVDDIYLARDHPIGLLFRLTSIDTAQRREPTISEFLANMRYLQVKPASRKKCELYCNTHSYKRCRSPALIIGLKCFNCAELVRICSAGRSRSAI